MLAQLSAVPPEELLAVQEVVSALVDSFAGGSCAYYATTSSGLRLSAGIGPAPPSPSVNGPAEHTWPLGRGLLWLRAPDALTAEALDSLGVFVRYASLWLERASRPRADLQILLQGARQLAGAWQEVELLELAVEWGGRLCPGKKLGAGASGVTVGVPDPGHPGVWRGSLGEGALWVVEDPDEREREGLALWCQLVTAAREHCQARHHLTQANKLAALGQTTAGVAHELNTPLGSLAMGVQMALSSLEERPDRARSRLELAQEAVEQMQTIVGRLLRHARAPGPELRLTSLAQLARDTCPVVQHGFRSEKVGLELDLEEVRVQADPGELQQVLLNLLMNARDAVRGQPGARVRVKVGAQAELALMQVEDNGPGVRPELVERIFEAFYTTKEVGCGIGLGLSISREIVRRHGGELSCSESECGGAIFSLRLPLAEERQ